MLQQTPPSILTEDEKQVWIEIYPLVSGRAEQSDLFAVINFCRDEALHRRCMQRVASEGEMVDSGREGKRRHPMLAEAGSIRRRQAEFFRAFGMTPKAREEFPDAAPPDKPLGDEDDLQDSPDDFE